MGRKTYYISLAEGSISQVSTASSWDYQIQATDDEITHLREIFDQNYSSDWQGFWRAHIPYVQYHFDKTNDAYDNGLQQAFKMIYELGDEATKAHIKDQGLMDDLIE
ncbi:MAG: hydrolase [Bacillota bacterium]|uniref:hydrolase n=1 Tax=Bacillus sp. RO2 TaxID=2723913 RepID=UPI00145F6770|nr:hydrolase [Bacillus sp. RO2]MEA3320757.1 hydrolase [Bacillota bacterium]NMH75133.1 hydrolase [Bacillus sp. RO2]